MAESYGVLTTEGDHFLCDGQPWKWRGLTAFRALEMFLRGDPTLGVWIADAQAAKSNLLRVLSMKSNNTGWSLAPTYTPEDLVRFYEYTRACRLFVEMTVFADTKAMMPTQQAQLAWWDLHWNVASQFQHVVVELINEAGHSTQHCDPQAFPRPSGVMASHGSCGTDEDVVRPLWSYATYHARRPFHPADARGFTNYSAYCYQEDWPKLVPFIADEGAKPESYNHDIGYARRMGEHAGAGQAGGTFHCNEGVNGQRLKPESLACATEFNFGMMRGLF